MLNPTSTLLGLGGLAVSSLLFAPAHAADINQTTNAAAAQGTWNNATVWGGSAPTAGNNYFTTSGLITAGSTSLNNISVTGRIRDSGTVFGGDQLTINAGTELLLKGSGTYTSSGNVVLNGGMIRLSPDLSTTTTFAGTLHVADESYVGVVRLSDTLLDFSSTITGSSVLHIAAATGHGTNTANPVLTIVFSGDLSGFTGTFSLGGGSFGVNRVAVLDFNQNYNLPSTSFIMGAAGTNDILNLDQSLTFGSFSFGATALGAGTYDATALNTLFGNGSQFTGLGTLTVIPEPGSYAGVFGVGGLLAAFGSRRRRQDRQGTLNLSA